jgi:signal transduction histidine kinase
VLARGSGLANVRERLRLFFGGDATFTIHPQGVEITMPLQSMEADFSHPSVQTDGHPPLRSRTGISG